MDWAEPGEEPPAELARQAGLFPAAVMSEVMAPDGAMATGQQLVDFARDFGCRLIDVEQLYRAVLQD